MLGFNREEFKESLKSNYEETVERLSKFSYSAYEYISEYVEYLEKEILELKKNAAR